MKLITINKKRYNFPECWNELTEKQLLSVMDILFLKGFKAEHILLQLVKELAGMTQYQFLKADVYELEEYFYLCAFVLQSNEGFTKNVLPSYTFEGDVFYGPEDELMNLRMKEFTFTEGYYAKWFDSDQQDMEALNDLIGILYRPATKGYDLEKNPDGDRRSPYVENVSSWFAKTIIARWPMNVKIAIAHWYDGCRRHIVEMNPDVFGGSGEAVENPLVDMMLEIAETHAFGDFHAVAEQHVNLVMMNLNRIVRRNQKIEAQTKS